MMNRETSMKQYLFLLVSSFSLLSAMDSSCITLKFCNQETKEVEKECIFKSEYLNAIPLWKMLADNKENYLDLNTEHPVLEISLFSYTDWQELEKLLPVLKSLADIKDSKKRKRMSTGSAKMPLHNQLQGKSIEELKRLGIIAQLLRIKTLEHAIQTVLKGDNTQ